MKFNSDFGKESFLVKPSLPLLFPSLFLLITPSLSFNLSFLPVIILIIFVRKLRTDSLARDFCNFTEKQIKTRAFIQIVNKECIKYQSEIITRKSGYSPLNFPFYLRSRFTGTWKFVRAGEIYIRMILTAATSAFVIAATVVSNNISSINSTKNISNNNIHNNINTNFNNSEYKNEDNKAKFITTNNESTKIKKTLITPSSSSSPPSSVLPSGMKTISSLSKIINNFEEEITGNLNIIKSTENSNTTTAMRNFGEDNQYKLTSLASDISTETASTAQVTIHYMNSSALSSAVPRKCPPNAEYVIFPETERYCNWTWDTFLCWPPTVAGTLAKQPCPSGHGIDVTKFAERRCGIDGKWMGKDENSSSQYPNGWTNYTPCYTPETNDLMKKIYSHGDGEMKFDIIERTRTLEIVGLMLSLLALVLSLAIFCSFRSLRNNRTRIHKNLFVAMVIQVLIRLILYFDQAIIRRGNRLAGNGSTHGIENTPYLCEASYVFLEYAGTAMFMWMFIEGLYLHNVVTVTVFQGRFPHTLYAIVGWGGPVIITTIWALLTAKYKYGERCWWHYNLTPYYWILEGPRLTVILVNFFFLLNIIRVLIVKLRQSRTSDIEQARKAVRAAVVLLPLLGITNLLHMTDAPLDRTVWEFALWSYSTQFLRSFQGFFIALIYCFLNGEVRAALLKSLSVYMSLRGYSNWIPRRASMFSGAYNTAPDTEGQCNDNSSNRQNSSPRHQGSKRRFNNRGNRSWMMSLCFRGQKVLREPPVSSAPPETNV